MGIEVPVFPTFPDCSHIPLKKNWVGAALARPTITPSKPPGKGPATPFSAAKTVSPPLTHSPWSETPVKRRLDLDTIADLASAQKKMKLGVDTGTFYGKPHVSKARAKAGLQAFSAACRGMSFPYIYIYCCCS